MSNARKKIAQKILKLQKIADCPTGNSNETAAAAARATELMAKECITMEELRQAAGENDRKDRPGHRSIYTVKSEPESWKLVLFSGLAVANDCYPTTGYITEPRIVKGKLEKVPIQWDLYIWGDEESCRFIEMLFKRCMVEIFRYSKLWCDARLNPDLQHKRKKELRETFCLGQSQRLVQRCQFAKEKVMQEAAAQAERTNDQNLKNTLVHVGNKLKVIEEFLEEEFQIKTREENGENVRQNKDIKVNQSDMLAFQSGVIAGDQVDINPDKKRLAGKV